MAGRQSLHPEPGLFLAGVMALLVHVIFAGFMLFGLNWKTQPLEGMVVDLWHDYPQPAQPIVERLPVKSESKPIVERLPVKSESKPVVEQPPVKSEPKQSKPVQPVQKESPPPPKKPEIVQATKKEKQAPVAGEVSIQKKQQSELEKKRKKEAAEEAEAQRRQQEQAQQQQREEAALAAQRKAQQAAAHARIMSEIAKYRAMILAKVRSRIVMPPDLPGNPMAEFGVTLLPGGDILSVQLHQGSGFASFDSAVERAIFLSQPLPLPPNPELFREFRNLNITVHYQE